MNMPMRPRTPSKICSQPHSTRVPRKPRSSKHRSSATTMDIQDSAQPHFSYPSSLLQRHSRDREITQWIAAKDEFSYGETSYAPGPLYMTGSDSSFLTDDLQNPSGVSWESTMPMDDLIFEQCQPFMTNEPYQLSDASGSSNSASQSMFDPLAIDPAISLPTAPYTGSNALTVGMIDNSFKNDFASGPISYDSSSSVYMSPPVSPELQEQTWPEFPSDYGTNAEYSTHGTTKFMYPQLGGLSHRLSSPPSPPISDGDSHAALVSVRQPLLACQLSLETPVGEAGASTIQTSGGRSCGSASVITPTSARLSCSVSQTPTQSSRPAQRILKPASEKPTAHDQGSQPAASPTHMKPREKLETVQPRNHHLYKALPGKDGLFRCPFAQETLCAHMPTKQKCGYE